MELNSLRELYISELKDLYSAEKQLVKALPTMAKKATNPALKQAFQDHLAQTETHVERLEEVFESLGVSPRGKKCQGMEGLIEEAKELLGEEAHEDVLDAGLISKAQHVEHYEMAGYGTVRTYALTLGETEQADILQRTLNEEAQTDELLTRLAERSVNLDAAVGVNAEREIPRRVASERGTRTTAGTRNAGRPRRSTTAKGEARAR